MGQRHFIKDYITLILGTLFTALAFNMFFIPHRIAPGGVSGIGTIIYHLLHVPVGITMLVLNIPLFVIGIRQLGGGFGFRTLLATLLLSLFIDVIKVPSLTEDAILASVYGGVLMGVGLGMVFKVNATTGGTDLFAKILHKYLPFIGVGWVMFVIDFLVVFTAALVFGSNEALYALVSLFLGAKVIDLVQEGLNSAKAFIVISDHSRHISQMIMKEMDRGATLLNGKGAYTMADKEIILCVVNRMQIARLKEIIAAADPRAFVLVADVREVMGEGF